MRTATRPGDVMIELAKADIDLTISM